MRVLYISNFLDNTGWARQSIDSILALDSVGIDVVPRAIKLNNVIGEVPERIRKLEAKSDKNPDVVIQNVLPPFAKYSGKVGKNIIYYLTETSNFKTSGWSDEINLMDEAWVFSKYSAAASKQSGVKIPTKLVPMPMDLNKFNKEYNNNILGIRNEIGGEAFIFYTISEFTKRKNIETILRAFHSEFAIDESVHLLIKTTDAAHGNNIQNHVFGTIERVKRELRIYKDPIGYKKEIIICGNFNNEDLYGVHMTCNAFVSASHGEGWCLPCSDSMGFGKIIIAPRHSSFMDYLTDNNSYLVDSYPDNCYGATDAIQGLYSANEDWFEVPVSNLRKQMRNAYEQRNGAALKKSQQAKMDVQKYSYEKVGNIIKGLL